jgi:hypothetical protein
MIYVFDTGPFIHLFKSYYQDRFPTLWDSFHDMISKKKIISVRETQHELLKYEGEKDPAGEWAKNNLSVFHPPTEQETIFIGQIFENGDFQNLLGKKQLLSGRPVADPFVIAKAKCTPNSCVVTLEKYKPDAPKIPNVCEYFNIDCIDLEEFMKRENWTF